MQLWISRDSQGLPQERITLLEEKPILNGSFYELTYWRDGSYYKVTGMQCDDIDTEVSTKAIGLTLGSGECRRVKSIEIVLEDEV